MKIRFSHKFSSQLDAQIQWYLQHRGMDFAITFENNIMATVPAFFTAGIRKGIIEPRIPLTLFYRLTDVSDEACSNSTRKKLA